MRKALILTSAVVAGLASCGFVERDMWLPAFACTGWNIFLLIVNTGRKKRRAGTRRKVDKENVQRPIYSYSTARGGWRQAYEERWYT